MMTNQVLVAWRSGCRRTTQQSTPCDLRTTASLSSHLDQPSTVLLNCGPQSSYPALRTLVRNANSWAPPGDPGCEAPQSALTTLQVIDAAQV